MLAKYEDMKWDNEDNKDFYEVIQAQGLQKFAEKGGLTNGCDLQILKPYWSQAKSILEVGAGYGRVIDYLLKHQFQGTITAVERCNVLCEYLEKNFNRYKNVRLLHQDVRYLQEGEGRFDLILMLWSGIADFSQKEQALVVVKLANLLKKEGKLIIDTLPPNVTPLQSSKCSQQTYLLEMNNATKYIYEPNAREIKEYGKNAGFSRIMHISCQTENKRMRWLHILN